MTYVLEPSPEGCTLVVTGGWSRAAEGVLERGEADGLVLNTARGFAEASLWFLDGSWGLRRLDILDRGLVDLAPIERLAGSLEKLSIQAAPSAELDLGTLPAVRSVAADWCLLRDTLADADALRHLITWRFDEPDMRPFRDHAGLERLTIKEAPHLRSLSGLARLPALQALEILLARRLSDISDVAHLAALREFKLEQCPGVDALDDVELLTRLRVLGISDCGNVRSLAPLRSLVDLETFYGWGSTRVMDEDLTPLARLPRLAEVRMRDRREYRPHVAELPSPRP